VCVCVSIDGIGSMQMALYDIAVCYTLRCSVNQLEHSGISGWATQTRIVFTVMCVYVSIDGIGSMQIALYAIAVCYIFLIRCSVNQLKHLGS